jgi:hypothetical protein
MNLTPEQIAEVYNLITTQNMVFVKALAAHAIKASAEVKADMWSQIDGPKPGLPDEDEIRDMTTDYFADMLGDFQQSFEASVKAIPLTIHYDLVSNLKIGD